MAVSGRTGKPVNYRCEQLFYRIIYNENSLKLIQNVNQKAHIFFIQKGLNTLTKGLILECRVQKLKTKHSP